VKSEEERGKRKEERGKEKLTTRAKDARKMYFFWEILPCGRNHIEDLRLET